MRTAPGACEGLLQHYVTAGAGEPVVLLHGFAQTWREWRRDVIPALARRYRVIVPDPLGDVDRGVGAAISASFSSAVMKPERPPLGSPRSSFRTISSQGVTALSISAAHAQRAGTLAGRHRDPFDRMLVAQSLIDGLPVVSADPVFDDFGVTRLG